MISSIHKSEYKSWTKPHKSYIFKSSRVWTVYGFKFYEWTTLRTILQTFLVTVSCHCTSKKPYERGTSHWSMTEKSVDLDSEARKGFCESYLYCKSYKDSIIFQHMHFYVLQGDGSSERWWHSQLSSIKERDVKKLIQHQTLITVLDRLLSIKNFWTDQALKLSSLNNVLSQRCDKICSFFSDSECSLINVENDSLSQSCENNIEHNLKWESSIYEVYWWAHCQDYSALSLCIIQERLWLSLHINEFWKTVFFDNRFISKIYNSE